MRTDPPAAGPSAAEGIWPSAAVFVASVVLAIAAGCGGGRPGGVPVEGTVTVDGVPLEAGTISFLPDGDTPGPKVAAAVTDGRFRLPAAAGPPGGLYRVEIVAESPAAPASDAEPTPAGLAALRRNPPPPVEPLPAEYNSASELRRLLGDGENRLDFDLTRSP